MSAVSTVVLLCRLAELGAVAWAAVVDVRERIVPYTSMALVAVSGLAVRFLTPHDPVWPSVLTAFVLFVLLSLLAGLGFFGGGDAKLIAAAVLGETVQGSLSLLLEIALAGGALACLYVLGARLFRAMGAQPAAEGEAAARGLLSAELGRMGRREPMPYAVAILAGLLWRTTPEVMRCLSSVSCSP